MKPYKDDFISAEDAYNRILAGDKDPQLVDIVAQSSHYSLMYACNVIKNRFPKGEAAIASEAFYAYSYAHDVIKGKWSKGEAVIAKHPVYAYEYARRIIKGRWPKGEKAIATSAYITRLYANL